MVAPPSVHPDSPSYTFKVAPNGYIPEMDLEELLGARRMDSSPHPSMPPMNQDVARNPTIVADAEESSEEEE